jgi:hypothetical protein
VVSGYSDACFGFPTLRRPAHQRRNDVALGSDCAESYSKVCWWNTEDILAFALDLLHKLSPTMTRADTKDQK